MPFEYSLGPNGLVRRPKDCFVPDRCALIAAWVASYWRQHLSCGMGESRTDVRLDDSIIKIRK